MLIKKRCKSYTVLGLLMTIASCFGQRKNKSSVPKIIHLCVIGVSSFLQLFSIFGQVNSDLLPFICRRTNRLCAIFSKKNDVFSDRKPSMLEIDVRRIGGGKIKQLCLSTMRDVCPKRNNNHFTHVYRWISTRNRNRLRVGFSSSDGVSVAIRQTGVVDEKKKLFFSSRNS